MQTLFGIVFMAVGAALLFIPAYEPKAPPKQWLNKDVYGATRIAHWAKGEVFTWVSLEGTRYYIFRDEDGSIGAAPALYKSWEPVTHEDPTPQPDEITNRE